MGINLSSASDKCCLIEMVSKLSGNQQTPGCHSHPGARGHLPLLGNSWQILFTFWLLLCDVCGGVGCTLNITAQLPLRLGMNSRNKSLLLFLNKVPRFIINRIIETIKQHKKSIRNQELASFFFSPDSEGVIFFAFDGWSAGPKKNPPVNQHNLCWFLLSEGMNYAQTQN